MEKFITSKEAADLIGVTEYTLRLSRSTGKLWGMDTPKYYKLGYRTVRYSKPDIDAWIMEVKK